MIALAAAIVVAVPPPLAPAQSDYVEHCGGCHGIQGRSFPARVPQLRGRAGYFLCTPGGRAYLLRVPNVAMAPLDDARLAAAMNFVAFDLGRTDATATAPRFTAAEVARARKAPLTTTSLIRARASVVREIGRRCHVPSRLLDF